MPAEIADHDGVVVREVPDDEPAHEIECPACSATIRARMADAPVEVTDARILDLLADAWHSDCPPGSHPSRDHMRILAVLIPAVRTLIREATKEPTRG